MITGHEISKLSEKEQADQLVPLLKSIQRKIDRLSCDKTGKLKEYIKERIRLENKYRMLTGREYF